MGPRRVVIVLTIAALAALITPFVCGRGNEEVDAVPGIEKGSNRTPPAESTPPAFGETAERESARDAGLATVVVRDRQRGTPLRRFCYEVVESQLDRIPVGGDCVDSSDGEFTFRFEPGLQYRITVAARGYRPARVTLESTSLSPSRRVDVLLDRAAGEARGRVTEVDTGRPIAGVVVYPAHEWPDAVEMLALTKGHGAVTDADGLFTLDACFTEGEGGATLAFRHARYQQLELIAWPGDFVQASLHRAPRIHGVVRSDTGAPWPGAKVEVWNTNAKTEVYRANAAGEYSTDGLAAGTYYVSLSLGRGVETAEQRRVVFANEDVRVDLGPGADSIRLDGRVEIVAGLSARGATLTLSDTHERRSFCVTTRVDHGSRFSCMVPPRGDYAAVLRRRGSAAIDWSGWLRGVQPADPSVRLVVYGGAIAGRVEISDGAGATPGVARGLAFRIEKRPRGDILGLTTDKDGRFSFAGLRPGQYRFGVEHGVAVTLPESVDVQEGRLVDGVRVEVRRVTSLVVIIEDVEQATDTMSVEVVREGDPARRIAGREIVRSRDWYFPDLVPGAYEIVATSKYDDGPALRDHVVLEPSSCRRVVLRVHSSATAEVWGRIRSSGNHRTVWAIEALPAGKSLDSPPRRRALIEGGIYRISGLAAGAWDVRALVAPGITVRFATVQLASGERLRHDWTRFESALRLDLCDERTGLAVRARSAEVRVWSRTSGQVAKLHGRDTSSLVCRDLARDEYDLEIMASDYAPVRIRGVQVVDTEMRTMRVLLNEGGRIRVPRSPAWKIVDILTETGTKLWPSRRAEAGALVFTGLAPGRYRVRRELDGARHEIMVEVRAGTETAVPIETGK